MRRDIPRTRCAYSTRLATEPPMPSPDIHLAAWNVNHRTGRKAIPPTLLHAIASLDIDVLVLTEFVDGKHHDLFKESLKDIGYSGLAVSLKGPQQNQVLIAARTELAADDLLPLPGYSDAAATNWLHRRLPALDLEVVGLRSPTYVTPDGREGYWNQVAHIARLALGRRLIFIGDLGTDPATDTRGCAKPLQRLFADGFALTTPQGDWSHRLPDGRTTRVDHAFATPALTINEARYLYKAGRQSLVGAASGAGETLSDHALLSIRIARSTPLPCHEHRPNGRTHIAHRY
jgi:hypothetical protein